MARYSGARGSVYLTDTPTKLADSYSWEFDEAQDLLDASIINEPFKRYMPDVGSGRVRVQSFVSSVLATPLSSLTNTDLVSAAGVGTPVSFILQTVDAGAGVNNIISGQGYIVRSSLRVARDGIITDEFEIEVDGKPVVN